MSDSSDFLNALYGPYDGDLAFELDGQPTDYSQALLDAAEAGEDAYLIPLTPNGDVSFVYGVAEDAAPDEWREFQRIPTAALFRPYDGTTQGVLICAWALESAFKLEDVQSLADALGCDLSEPIPLPGANGWRLMRVDDTTFYSLEELQSVYIPETEEPEAEVVVDAEIDEVGEPTLQTYGDAVVMTPGWHPDADPRLAVPYPISQGAKAQAFNWTTKMLPLGATLAALCTHKEGAKDGPGFVGGELIGERRVANAVKQTTFIGLDLDTGMPAEDIDAALKAFGCVAVRYTTHSNMKTATDFSKQKVAKFAKEKGFDGDDYGVELMSAFMRDVAKYEPYVVASISSVEEDQTEAGFVIRVHHCPVPKNRIIFPMAEPFVMAKEASQQKDAHAKWKKVIYALGEALGVPFDSTGTDPSRLFYYPRHPRGKPFEIRLFGGDLFDWRSLEIENPLLDAAEAMVNGGKRKGKSKTDEGQKLGRWGIKNAEGFQIVDLLRDHAEDRIRAEVSAGIELECPFDEDHSNAGDPDDRACLAVNAGEGVSEIFTISCRHETCQDKTNLDMLGKMIKDQWFEETVIWDDQYNAAATEDQPTTVVDNSPTEKPGKQTLDEMVESLTKQSSAPDIMKVIKQASKLPTRFELDAVLRVIRTKTGMPMKSLAAEADKAWNPLKNGEGPSPAADNGDEIIDKHTGIVTFRYYQNYNADDAKKCCERTMMRANEEMPIFTCSLNEPMRLYKDKDTKKLTFVPLSHTAFWAELSDRIFFQRKSDTGDGAREQVPKDIAAQLYETAWKKLPDMPEIIYTPIYTETGELLREPGWHRELGIIMAETDFVVPEVFADPTEDEVAEALRALREDVLGEFPFLDFTSDGHERREPSEANALAMIITPFMRRMISGCTPIFFVSKPTAGTGGTLLGKVPMLLFDGEEPFPLAYTTNDEEQRKALLTAIMETRSHLFYDDVKDFNSRVILQSVTARKIGGRVLGKSVNAERPNRFNWVSTGNNPYINSEMERRICWIRLNAKTPDIQNRKFKHADYPGYIQSERARFVHAVLVLIQNWIAKGRPRFETRKLVSFEEWGALVGGIIEAAWPEHGFLDNRRLVSADMDLAAVRDFVKMWYERFHHNPESAKTLFDHAMDLEHDIIEGNTETQRRTQFKRRLETLDGQIFTVKDKATGTPKTVMGRKTTNADGDPVYMLELREDSN